MDGHRMRMDELMRVFRVKIPLTWTRIGQFINPSSCTKPNVRQWTMDLVTSAQKLQIASLARAPSSLPLSPFSPRISVGKRRICGLHNSETSSQLITQICPML